MYCSASRREHGTRAATRLARRSPVRGSPGADFFEEIMSGMLTVLRSSPAQRIEPVKLCQFLVQRRVFGRHEPRLLKEDFRDHGKEFSWIGGAVVAEQGRFALCCAPLQRVELGPQHLRPA